MSLQNYVRPIGLLILLCVTVYGVHELLSGDWNAVADFWLARVSSLPLALLLASLSVGLEAIGWMWVYEEFRICAWDPGGACAFLAGRAGLLLPVQLGRLIRQDSMVRLQRGSVTDTLKAEFVAFFLDGLSVLALLAGLGAFTVYPLAAPAAALGTIALFLLLANRVTTMLSGTRLALPQTFWWRRQTFGILFVGMGAWVAQGLALWTTLRGLPGQDLWGSLFFAPLSSIVGTGSGVPGGAGATEGVLGVSLRFMEIPNEHMLLVVTAFRLVTFWVWLPVGFIAFSLIGRRVRLKLDAEADREVG